MTANVPTMATGTAISGMSVARQFCRNTSTTMATRMIGVAQRLEDLVDRLVDERRGVVDDRVVEIRRESCCFSSSICVCESPWRCRARWSRAAGRSPGRPTVGRRACRTCPRSSRRVGCRRTACPTRPARASVTMSRMRVSWPSSPILTTMSPNCSGSISRPSVLSVYWKAWPVGTGGWPSWPAATCTFCSRRAVDDVAGRQVAGGQLLRDRARPACCSRAGRDRSRRRRP